MAGGKDEDDKVVIRLHERIDRVEATVSKTNDKVDETNKNLNLLTVQLTRIAVQMENQAIHTCPCPDLKGHLVEHKALDLKVVEYDNHLEAANEFKKDRKTIAYELLKKLIWCVIVFLAGLLGYKINGG